MSSSKQKPPSFASLPAELVHQIVSHTSLYDLLRLARVNLYIRNIIKNLQFGSRYLAKDAKNLHVDVTIFTTITALDEFDLGYCRPPNNPSTSPKSPPSIFLHHRTPTTSTIHTITINPSGHVKLSSKTHQTPLICPLSPSTQTSTLPNNQSQSQNPLSRTPIPASHIPTCPFCTTINPLRYTHATSKRFLVFFANWRDTYKFPSLPFLSVRGASVVVNVVNEEGVEGEEQVGQVVPRWGIGGWSKPVVRVERYGLLQNAEKGTGLEKWFGLTGVEVVVQEGNGNGDSDEMSAGSSGVSRSGEGPHPADADAPRAYFNPWA